MIPTTQVRRESDAHRRWNMSKSTATPVWRIVLAWLIVAVPFGWGIFEAVKSSIRLFWQ